MSLVSMFSTPFVPNPWDMLTFSVGVALLLASIYMYGGNFRCPHCNSRMPLREHDLIFCPYCGGRLYPTPSIFDKKPGDEGAPPSTSSKNEEGPR
ncbi:hypothetical protein [Akkermansia muciniphila]|uniref:hypothetical protein n=1 Tax=Akkermansia muciniphila TaxID=239935 RepID=UPI0019610337|nr:hypothetical protein [Akkermansia muciniphila]